MILVIFLRNFDRILSEFHGYSQKMMKYLEFLIKSARKMRKKTENSGTCAKFKISFVHFIFSILSLVHRLAGFLFAGLGRAAVAGFGGVRGRLGRARQERARPRLPWYKL